jgi:hypothetical protein
MLRAPLAFSLDLRDCYYYLAGPRYEQQAILYADTDLADLIRAKHVGRNVCAPLQEVRP